MKNINIDISDELHQGAKLKALNLGITLKQFVIQSIEAYLKRK